jgi:predicted RNA-binding Zn-ribbon protein involved in translation (DUF1610 family)
VKLKHWTSGREEIRKVPIVCNVCNEQVSVGGWVQEDKLVFENCPNCGLPIRCEMFGGTEKEKDDQARNLPLYADVKWSIEGPVSEPERTGKIGPLYQVSSLLVRVMAHGAQYFSGPQLPESRLFGAACNLLVRHVLTPEHVANMIAVGTERLEKASEQAPDSPIPDGFVVLPTGGNNGYHNKPTDDEDAKSDDNKETDDDE